MPKEGTGRPRGRPAKPTEQHRALGNPSRKVLPVPPRPGEALPAALTVPEPPALGVDGLELWNLVWTAGRSWLSPQSDFELVAMLCHAKDEAEECRRLLTIGEVPRFYVLPNGSYVTHPVVVQLKDLRTQMTAWLSALGFSPADRARLGVGEVRADSALDELQRRRDARAAAK